MEKLFLFAFEKYAGFDRIFFVDKKETKSFSKWDLIEAQGFKYLVIWEEISFKELYTYQLRLSATEIHILQKKFLDSKTIDFVNFLVYTYYSTYKKVLNSFLNFDIENMFKEEIKKSYKPAFQKAYLEENTIKFDTQKIQGQQLIVFPDLWTLEQSTKGWEKGALIMHWMNTKKQRNKAFREIKKWKTSTLLCTHSQIFKPWKNLKNILMVDSHRWYYKNQQDPRYSTYEVLEKLSKIHKSDLKEYWYRIF